MSNPIPFQTVVEDGPLVIDITGPRQKGKSTLALALARLLKGAGYGNVIKVMNESDAKSHQNACRELIDDIKRVNDQHDIFAGVFEQRDCKQTPVIIIDSGQEQWHYQDTTIKGYAWSGSLPPTPVFRAIDLTKLDQLDMDLEIERLAVLAESRGETARAFMLRQALTAGNIDPAKAYSAPADDVEAEDVVTAIQEGINLAQYVKALVREHPMVVEEIAGDSNQWGIHSIEPYARMVDCILRNTNVTKPFSRIDALL